MPKTKQAPKSQKPIEDYASLVETLMVRQKSLPKRLNQIAQFFLNNPEDVAIYNIVGLSKLAGVPAANITRFAKELGFAGFADLQDVFRQRLVGPRMTYADRIKALGDARIKSGENELDLEQPRAIFDTFVQTAVDSLLRLREDVDDGALQSFVDAMADCEAIHICAARGAFGIGAYSFYGLAKVGKPVHLIDNLGAMRVEQVRAIRKNDAVLLLTFDDYTAETVDVAEMAAERQIPVLAITDNELSPVVGLADHVLYVKEAHLGHFRSQVPAFVLCQSLIVSLSRKLA
ncbi:MurR/RpiR family transcriptional regulator [Hoeflea prorocentri]|uniref:MurR/RpiR family transcriptional regulator n=1 Tax=Hoeflea prorocentri TaxID=1922333 RepID=A0A9X3ZHG3_9HYPH|nr:MurR/RpiR family transcriptional regulator [Hoeflea prorocentri]MCY6381792.1 MurR/RpiR family transcriptional regulator [Hoeflea prorocentri]MDA5399592.1 MurR/RpiR family transcriptional regulator [Hoeflea prorocentri]